MGARRSRRGVERRRRLLVSRLQTRTVVVQLGWTTALLAVFAGALFAPTAYDLFASTGARQHRAAGLFLELHARLWPALVGLVAALTAVTVVHSHRVVGPLVRFKAVFDAVSRGELHVSARIRARDYPQIESQALEAMLVSLRLHIGAAQDAASELGAALQHLPGGYSSGTGSALGRLRVALATYEVDAPPAAAAPLIEPPSAHDLRAPAGYTLVEILMVSTLIGLISAIAVPGYEAALERARVVRAIGDIRSAQSDVQAHWLVNGCFPATLEDVGHGSMRDPWGSAYVYGVLEGAPGKGRKGTGAACAACSGACLGRGQARKDRNLVPINSDFDFYSMGKDRQSVAPLAAKTSLDDVVRASDGGFIGLGRDF